MRSIPFCLLTLFLFMGTALGATCPTEGDVLVNEFSYDPKETAFIELWDPRE